MNKEKKVIIVEDEVSLSKALQAALTEEDIKFITAYDGKAALDMINSQKPDVILLDIMLPKMDGFSLLEILKGQPETKDIPVIILSNLGQEEDIEKGKQLGAVDYVVKARIDLENFVAKVKKYLS
ncbi:response regulator [Candidatus Parcubacteria bacterium]|jgi:two-component system, cell cycle response regulator|nr:response regulator [Candidatus Parcubacteria bacterium]